MEEMKGVKFYRGRKSDSSLPRSNCERYNEIGGLNSPIDNRTKINDYHFYTGSNFDNSSVMQEDAGKKSAHKDVQNQSQDSGNAQGSIKSFDSTEKQKSFRRLIIRFAEKTSMTGVPYINNAKFWWARLIWCFMLLVAIAAMSLHLWYLIDQYTDYPVQTKISLGFQTLDFPEVTLCNVNIINKRRLDDYKKAEKLKELLDELHPENLVPNQYLQNNVLYASKSPSTGKQQGDANQGLASQPPSESNFQGGQQSVSISGPQKPLIVELLYFYNYILQNFIFHVLQFVMLDKITYESNV
ncbi:uncharacterized protein LOC132735297 [Ruditapes philippinarum]|uniref:uncharacterized protein LOC132735297 n=1 Tax=Ruditapes philippinarum TaxID=129788 RepID=UPI00295B50E1|nr:uncharacterized protein LOC132735297 [Ruditapes philippinarum]